MIKKYNNKHTTHIVNIIVFHFEISGKDNNNLHAEKKITHIDNIISIPF